MGIADSIIAALNTPINSVIFGGAIAAGFGSFSTWLMQRHDLKTQKENIFLGVYTELCLLKVHATLLKEHMPDFRTMLEGSVSESPKVELKQFSASTAESLLASFPAFLSPKIAHLLIILAHDIGDINFTISAVPKMMSTSNKLQQLEKIEAQTFEIIKKIDLIIPLIEQETSSRLQLERTEAGFGIKGQHVATH